MLKAVYSFILEEGGKNSSARVTNWSEHLLTSCTRCIFSWRKTSRLVGSHWIAIPDQTCLVESPSELKDYLAIFSPLEIILILLISRHIKQIQQNRRSPSRQSVYHASKLLRVQDNIYSCPRVTGRSWFLTPQFTTLPQDLTGNSACSSFLDQMPIPCHMTSTCLH
ncbi:hypothetical protein J6590_053975 [Homalodisca vitripennis]|nr:hypothetical protein J6590_053975 [Homalodisca vitripennis]